VKTIRERKNGKIQNCKELFKSTGSRSATCAERHEQQKQCQLGRSWTATCRWPTTLPWALTTATRWTTSTR